MDSLESLTRQITGAKDLNSIVRTMKAMAAANIGQYEMAMESLGDYWNNVSLGLVAYLKNIKLENDSTINFNFTIQVSFEANNNNNNSNNNS